MNLAHPVKKLKVIVRIFLKLYRLLWRHYTPISVEKAKCLEIDKNRILEQIANKKHNASLNEFYKTLSPIFTILYFWYSKFNFLENGYKIQNFEKLQKS